MSMETLRQDILSKPQHEDPAIALKLLRQFYQTRSKHFARIADAFLGPITPAPPKTITVGWITNL